MYDNVEVLDFLLGETIVKIEDAVTESECIDIYLLNGKHYRMEHHQDCCEHVELNDVIGDVNDLLNSPLTMAESVAHKDYDRSESATWTFYKFATIKGYVTLRWLGESNGYYSEDVSIYEVKPDVFW